MRCVRARSRSSPDVRRTRSTSRLKASSTCPPSRSRSATRVCASTSSGRAAAAARAACEVDPCGALQHLGHRQAARRLGVGRVGVDQLLVLRDGARRCRRRPARPRRRRTWGRRPAPRLLRRGRRADSGWCRPVMPWAVSCWSICVHGQRPQLVERRGVLEERREPSLEHDGDERHRRHLERLGDLRLGVDVDPAERKRPSNSSARSRGHRPAGRCPAAGGRVHDQDTGAVMELSSMPGSSARPGRHVVRRAALRRRPRWAPPGAASRAGRAAARGAGALQAGQVDGARARRRACSWLYLGRSGQLWVHRSPGQKLHRPGQRGAAPETTVACSERVTSGRSPSPARISAARSALTLTGLGQQPAAGHQPAVGVPADPPKDVEPVRPAVERRRRLVQARLARHERQVHRGNVRSDGDDHVHPSTQAFR